MLAPSGDNLKQTKARPRLAHKDLDGMRVPMVGGPLLDMPGKQPVMRQAFREEDKV